MDVALMVPTRCPVCGGEFMGPGAEDLAFNSGGACPTCGGTGIVRTVDEATLVPDESKSINEGAVLPWGSLMWDLMKQVCAAMGVRCDVPFAELTPEERDIVFHGPAEKKHILYRAKNGEFAELDFTYYNAVYTVENALAKAKDEKGLARVARFLREDVCPDCGGTRLSARARGPMVDGMNLGEASHMTLDELAAWVSTVPDLMPGGDAPHGRDHRGRDGRARLPPAAAGLGVSRPRSRELDPLHRRAPARAARPRGAQPHLRRALRARRALHRGCIPPTSRGSSAWSTTCWLTETPWCWSTMTCGCCATRTIW